jgi:hypothetical protein
MRPNRSRIALAAVLLAVLASSAVAQSKVYVSASGKKYHTHADCRALKSSTVKTIDLKDIGDRTLCAICAHRKAGK